MNHRAKTITVIAMALGAAVLVLGAIALSDPVAEWWYLRKLNAGTPEGKSAAARKLGAMGSVRAIPALLEMAGGALPRETNVVGGFRRLPGPPIRLIPADLDGDGVADLFRPNRDPTGLFPLGSDREEFQPLLQVDAKRRLEALQALRSALAHPQPEVRCCAALVLASVESRDDALRMLMTALRAESTAWVRRRLEAALSVETWSKPVDVKLDIDILWPNPMVAPGSTRSTTATR